MWPDEDAFCYWHRRLAGIVSATGAPPSEVDNLVIEAMTRFSEKDVDLAESGALLKKIAINVTIDFLRKKGVRDRFAKSAHATPTTDPPLEAVQRDELSRAMAQALRELPPGEAIVIYLHAVDRHEWNVICEYLGISLSAAQGRYKRGLEKLRQNRSVRRFRS